MSGHELNKLLKERRKAQANGNLSEEAKLCNAIGELYSRNGQFKEAVVEHQAELQLSQSLNDTIGAAIAHRKIGECHCGLEDYDTALKHQKLHLTLAEEAFSDIEVQRAQATIGRTYLFKADNSSGSEAIRAYRQAELAFWKSFEVCKKLESSINALEFKQMKCRLLLNLGIVSDGKNERQKGLDLIKRAILLAQRGNLYEDLHRCHYAIADMLERSGLLSQALRSIDTSIGFAQKGKDKFAEWESTEKKAKILLQVQDFAASRRCLKKILKSKHPSEQLKERLEDLLKAVRHLSQYDEKSKNTDESAYKIHFKINEKMGDSLAGMNFNRPALQYYHKMLEYGELLHLPPSGLIPVYISLSQTYKDDKQYSKAILYSKKELECHVENHEQACRTLLNIAEYMELGGEDYEVIKASYTAALQEAEQAGDARLQFHTLKSLSIVQKINKDDGLSTTVEQLEDLMTTQGFTMEDDIGDSQEGTVDDPDDDSDVSLQDFTDSDSSEAEEEYDRNQAAPAIALGRAKRTAPVKRNEKGETPLHRACIEGKLRTVKTLVEKGHPLNPRDFCGWLPLHEAANHDHVEIVQYLLEHGAWINDRGGDKCGGVTPLHDAAACANLDVVKLLVQKGANVHAKDDEGSTALDSLKAYRHNLRDDVGRTEMAEIIHVEKLIQRTMHGNNPHMVSNDSSYIRDYDDGDIEDLPEITRRPKSVKKSLSTREMTHNLDDEEDPEDLVLQVDHSALDMLQNVNTASTAYRNAISEQGSAASRKTFTPQPSEEEPELRPALISNDEVGGDDWLIDDLRPTVKRKLGDVDDVFKGTSANTKRKRSSTGEESSSENAKQSRVRKSSSYPNENDYSRNDHAEILSHTTGTSGVNSTALNAIDNFDEIFIDDDFAVPKPLSKNNVRKRDKSKQLTLTQCSSIQRSSQSSVRQHRPDTYLVEQCKPPEVNTTPETSVLRYRVTIKDKTLLVPIPKGDSEQCISELAAAASDRYYKRFSLRPILYLVKDGAILSADEPIHLVLSNDEEVEGVVDHWDLPSLQVRYSDACKSLRTTVYRNIETSLSHCENTQVLDLVKLSLRPAQFSPIARALQYQTLKVLNLEGNKLSDMGLQLLMKVAHTLPNLTVLNLTSNNISSTGLTAVMDCLAVSLGNPSEKPLQNLEKLVLSHNSLGNGVINVLIRILPHLPQLNTLVMSACDFTMAFFQEHRISFAEQLKASSIQNLDVSYNHLGSTGVELLLSCVNHNKLKTLDISHTIRTRTGNNIVKHMEHYLLKDGCNLENLIMNACCLCVDSVPHLSRMINQSKSLRDLSLCELIKLDVCDLQQLVHASNDTSMEKLRMTSCYLKGAISVDLIDAICSKVESDQALRQLHFDLACSVSALDKLSLTQVWTTKWGELSMCDINGKLVKLDVVDM